ncbi:MAG: ABC transporter ATP-binding protein [Candidatus Eiseniibacteriota bacterium]
MSVVRLVSVSKTYAGSDRPALLDLSLEVASGEFLVLVGPSGCGKSTALRSIAGLEDVDQGEVWIGDRDVTDVPPRDRDIAMVFQNYALYPHMTVYDNLAFGLKLRKTPKPDIDRRVREAAETLGLTRYLDRKPRALSGGERQRVALGRALVRRPKVFLFDEPLSNLDAQLRVQMRAELHRIHQQVSSTMIYVTHDQVEAMTLGDRIAVLKAGILQQVDTPLSLYQHPANRFVAGFIGSPSMNFLRGTVDTEGGAVRLDGATWAIPQDARDAARAQAGREVWVGVRPEHVRAEAAGSGAPAAGAGGSGSGLAGTVEFTEVLGAETLLHVKTSTGTIVVRTAPERASLAGSNVHLTADRDALHLFDTGNETSLRGTGALATASPADRSGVPTRS